MKERIGVLIFSAVLQFGGAIAIGYATTWVVGGGNHSCIVGA